MSSARDKIVIIGGGGHAKVLISILAKSGWDIVGYTDTRDRGALLSAPYLGDDSMLPSLLDRLGRCSAIVGIGKVDASLSRAEAQHHVEALGFDVPVIVSPNAVVNAGTGLGPGSAIFDGAVVSTGTVIGKACIINTNSTVEHDCHLGDNVHVAPGATVSGGVTVESHSVIGAGAIVIQGISICSGCLCGAGAVVTEDIAVPGTYVGRPARRVE